jgi:hypothetical protein
MTTSLTGTDDTDHYLLNFLNINEQGVLLQVNRHFHSLITSDKSFGEFKEFYKNRQDKDDTSNLYRFDNNYYHMEFTRACETNNLNIVKFIYYKYGDKINMYQLTRNSYDYGSNIKTLLWINDINIQNDFIDENFILNKFKYGCNYGHLNVVIWAIEESIKNGNPIDIHEEEDYIFINCCVLGHLKVAKYLYEYCNDIGGPIVVQPKNDSIFKYNCLMGNKEMIEWLASIIDRYTFDYDPEGKLTWKVIGEVEEPDGDNDRDDDDGDDDYGDDDEDGDREDIDEDESEEEVENDVDNDNYIKSNDINSEEID